MNALAAAGALFVATIGSWISMVGFGTTSWPCLPAANAAYASLSYVMRTSPSPEKNALAADEPDQGWATTFLNSFVTNCTAFLSFSPAFRAWPYAARTFHFAEPEGNGSGVTTFTPDLVRSFQVWMCLGLPGRTTKATTESAAMPP